MGIMVNKENQQNDELSRRISADLRAKALETVDVDGGGDVDLVEDAVDIVYFKDAKKPTTPYKIAKLDFGGGICKNKGG